MNTFEAKCSLVVDAYANYQRGMSDLGDLFDVQDLAMPGAVVVTSGLGVLNDKGRRYVEEAWLWICDAFGAPTHGEYWAMNDLPGWEGHFED